MDDYSPLVRPGASASASVSSMTLHHAIAALTANERAGAEGRLARPWAMPGAVASVPQLAQPGGDIHEAAEDSLNRPHTISPDAGHHAMEEPHDP